MSSKFSIRSEQGGPTKLEFVRVRSFECMGSISEDQIPVKIPKKRRYIQFNDLRMENNSRNWGKDFFKTWSILMNRMIFTFL